MQRAHGVGHAVQREHAGDLDRRRGDHLDVDPLGAERINIQMIATSPIKISCVIELEAVPTAVRALHAAFLS